MHHLEAGTWFVSIYNDDEYAQNVVFVGDIFGKYN